MQPLAAMQLRLPSMPFAASWTNLAADRKLACATLAALVCGMGFFGVFVSAHIKDNLVHKAAAATALYMDSFLAPLAQELATRTTLSSPRRPKWTSCCHRLRRRGLSLASVFG
jgi:hypothetical protein